MAEVMITQIKFSAVKKSNRSRYPGKTGISARKTELVLEKFRLT